MTCACDPGNPDDRECPVHGRCTCRPGDQGSLLIDPDCPEHNRAGRPISERIKPSPDYL